MATYQRTRTDYAGAHVETVTEYLASYCGRTAVRFTATSRAIAIQMAMAHFCCRRAAVTCWEE